MARLTTLGFCAALLLSGCGPSVAETRENGIAEFQLGHHDGAKQLLQQVLDQRPYDPQALYYMGRTMYADGEYEKAIFYLQSAVDADPGNTDARTYLAKAEEAAGAAGPALRFIP